MSLPRGFVNYILIAILVSIIVLQYRGASKAEQRAQQLEAKALDLDAQLKTFEQQSTQREALAESRYQASLQESANLRSILAKGSQAKPQSASQKQLEPILATPQPAKGSTGQEVAKAAPSACEAFIYQGSPLVIEGFQVAVCDQQPVVQAEAAVAFRDAKALDDKLTSQLAEATARLAIEDKDLAAYKVAEQGWKKAAKKSRIKRVLGVAEKVGLFAAGVYLGHRF